MVDARCCCCTDSFHRVLLFQSRHITPQPVKALVPDLGTCETKVETVVEVGLPRSPGERENQAPLRTKDFPIYALRQEEKGTCSFTGHLTTLRKLASE